MTISENILNHYMETGETMMAAYDEVLRNGGEIVATVYVDRRGAFFTTSSTGDTFRILDADPVHHITAECRRLDADRLEVESYRYALNVYDVLDRIIEHYQMQGR